jgi:hypothetical protein
MMMNTWLNAGMPLGARHTGMPLAVPHVYPAAQAPQVAPLLEDAVELLVVPDPPLAAPLADDVVGVPPLVVVPPLPPDVLKVDVVCAPPPHAAIVPQASHAMCLMR